MNHKVKGKDGSIPMWVWILVGVGVLAVVAGGVAAFVITRKKKNQAQASPYAAPGQGYDPNQPSRLSRVSSRATAPLPRAPGSRATALNPTAARPTAANPVPSPATELLRPNPGSPATALSPASPDSPDKAPTDICPTPLVAPELRDSGATAPFSTAAGPPHSSRVIPADLHHPFSPLTSDDRLG